MGTASQWPNRTAPLCNLLQGILLFIMKIVDKVGYIKNIKKEIRTLDGSTYKILAGVYLLKLVVADMTDDRCE